MDLSIVTTMYYSEPYLEEFYTRACAAANINTGEFEIIFVNDGSPDNGLEVAVALCERDNRVSVIDLSRNFGHHKAIMTGLAHAKGDLIFLIDSDLEEDPKLLSLFHKEMANTDADVVYGVQQRRKGGWLERFFGDAFFKLFNFLSSYPIPSNLITARLMSRRYVSNLVQHKDHEIFIAGLWAITGFKQIPIKVNKLSKGNSSYNLVRKWSILVNSVTSFSNKPLIYIFYLGICISFLSGLAGLYLIGRRVFFQEFLAGWPSLVVSVWFLGGITIFCLGIIGIYLSRVFTETKQRPYTVIRQIYGKTNQNEFE